MLRPETDRPQGGGNHLGTIVAVTGSWMDAAEAINPYLETEGLVQRYGEACPAELARESREARWEPWRRVDFPP